MADPFAGSNGVLYPSYTSPAPGAPLTYPAPVQATIGSNAYSLTNGTAVDVGTIPVNVNGSPVNKQIAVLVGQGTVNGDGAPVLAVIDISQPYVPGSQPPYTPASPYLPQPIGFFQLSANPTDVILDVNTMQALVRTGSNVLVVDLTDPYNPVSGNQITGSFGSRLALDSNGVLIAAGDVPSATTTGSTVQTVTLQANNKLATPACVTGALEEVIKYGEGTNGPNGYGLLVYGTVLSASFNGDILAAPQPGSLVGQTGTPGDPIVLDPNSLTYFPNILVQTGSVQSTAFGAYQFLNRSWPGGTDISPSAQDDAAATVIQQRNALTAAMSGNFQGAITDINKTWASLPGSPYGQPTISWEQAASVYQNAFTYLPECQTASGSMSPPQPAGN